MTHDPYAALPEVPAIEVTSASFEAGARLPLAQIGAMIGTGGGDLSPQLSWSGVPEGTASIAVTCYDPDAPTASGFWHLAAFGLPASTTELAEGAVTPGGAGDGLPAGTRLLRNDGGVAGFVGAAPPPGHGDHRYIFAVHALDVDLADLDDAASPAMLGFRMFGHTLARGTLTGVFGH